MQWAFVGGNPCPSLKREEYMNLMVKTAKAVFYLLHISIFKNAISPQ